VLEALQLALQLQHRLVSVVGGQDAHFRGRLDVEDELGQGGVHLRARNGNNFRKNGFLVPQVYFQFFLVP
jgi:hypothetical protein